MERRTAFYLPLAIRGVSLYNRGGKRGDAMHIKPWEELTIRDDYMFKLVMRRKHICKKRKDERKVCGRECRRGSFR